MLGTFWESHDPTTPFRQGNDRGTQYRSGIYYYTDEQRVLAEASKDAFETALRASGRIGPDTKIVTEIIQAPTFYFAESYHQQYDAKPGNRQYCGLRPLGVPCPPASLWHSCAGSTETTATDVDGRTDAPPQVPAAEPTTSSNPSSTGRSLPSATASNLDAPTPPLPHSTDVAPLPPAPLTEQLEAPDSVMEGAGQPVVDDGSATA